jgi:hypothetical protein
VRDLAERFADYWHAKAGKDAAKLDWPATWRNWCRKARDAGEGSQRTNGHGNGSGHGRRETVHEARRRTAEGFGVGPRDGTERDVIDLPPEAVNVIAKH